MKINNLKIKWSRLSEKWQVISPYGKVLEEFDKQEDAREWARKTGDFTVRKEQLDGEV